MSNFCNNFVNYYPILKILSLLETSLYYRVKHKI